VFISHNNQGTSRQIDDKRVAKAVARKIEAKLALGDFNIDEKKEKSMPLFKHCATIRFLTACSFTRAFQKAPPALG